MALYIRAGEQTGLKAGDVLAFDTETRTLCINRPPDGTLFFGENGVKDDNKQMLTEMASNPGSAFEIARLLAHVSGLKVDVTGRAARNPKIFLFTLMA